MMNGTNRPVDRDEHYTQSGPAAGGRDDNGLEPKLLRIKKYIFMFSAYLYIHVEYRVQAPRNTLTNDLPLSLSVLPKKALL